MRQKGKATEATTTCPCCIIAPANVIVDLGDGPEDSEYEDLEDELF